MIDKSFIDKNIEEHYVKRGDPSKPTYYICRRLSHVTGLFSIYRMIMGHVRYALSKGWIPVVDMQNYPNIYLAPDKLGKENSWEYYFEQPLRIGLEEAYNGENIILSNGDAVWPYPGHAINFLMGKTNELATWQDLIKNGLMTIKPERMKEILATRDKLFAPEDRVLGVLLRGTDYVVRKLKNHPIPPPVDLALSTVDEKLREWNCNKVYLATEDKSIVEKFKATFGDIFVVFDRKYLDYTPEKTGKLALASYHIKRPNDHFILGKDYLTQIVLLSMCNSIVAARCGGTSAATVMGEHFEHKYFFDLGRYK